MTIIARKREKSRVIIKKIKKSFKNPGAGLCRLLDVIPIVIPILVPFVVPLVITTISQYSANKQSHACADGGLECDLHHFVEAVLALDGVQCFAGEDVVGDREDRQRALVAGHCLEVNACGFHFDGEQAEVARLLVDFLVRMIEEIGGIHTADIRRNAHFPGNGNSGFKHCKISCWCWVSWQVVRSHEAGIGGGAHGDDDVADMDAVLDAAGGADADDGLDAKEIKQLVDVQACGRHAHAASHDGHFLALKEARIAQHISNIIEKNRILKIMVRNVFGAKRIPRHQHTLRNMRARFQ